MQSFTYMMCQLENISRRRWLVGWLFPSVLSCSNQVNHGKTPTAPIALVFCLLRWSITFLACVELSFKTKTQKIEATITLP